MTKSKAHSWEPVTRKLAYQHCDKCGLINLRNAVTAKAMNKPCPGREED